MSRNFWHKTGVISYNRNRFHKHLVFKRTLSHFSPLVTNKIHLPFYCKCWMSTKSDMLEILVLSQTWVYNTTLHEKNKRKMGPLVLSRDNFWMIWRCHNIPCFHFYFLLRNKSIREQLDESDFHRCYEKFFFWKCHSKNT